MIRAHHHTQFLIKEVKKTNEASYTWCGEGDCGGGDCGGEDCGEGDLVW